MVRGVGEWAVLILVTGPPLAGATSVAAALGARLPGHRVVETADIGESERPAAVVFVVSAAAPLVASDAELLAAAAARTDAVLAAVTKIDVHRDWRAVLAANRAALPGRHARTRWLAVAAAPEIGGPRIGELTAALRAVLADPGLRRRNRLRAREAELRARIAERERRHARREVLRDRAEHAAAVAAARLGLLSLAARHCAQLRAELGAAAARAGDRDRFAAHAGRRARQVAADVGRSVDRELPGPPGPPFRVPPVPPAGGGLERRLTALLAAGFGVGGGVTAGRVLADLLPRYAPGAGALGAPGAPGALSALGALAGIVLAVWLVRARRLLADRALLDRWVGELTAALRGALEEQVAARVLAQTRIARTGPPGPGAADGQALRRELDAVLAALW